MPNKPLISLGGLIVSGKVRLYFGENGSDYPIIFLHEFETDFPFFGRLPALQI
ncbi:MULTISPECIES: hypothetical protein [unclassified Bradyrhizobium]|uniref:hypothetical protein n=1 Tax=unclassified Bradyrhizobium TaxID=2631580 RepID=UPI002FF1A881